METSENLSLPYIMPSQAQKHVTHNEAIRSLDALVCLAVQSRQLTTPPTETLDGARYIVPENATDTWAGKSNTIASWQDGAWSFYEPQDGWNLWVADEGAYYVYLDGSWHEAAQVLASAIGILQNMNHLGVNTTADGENRLAVASNGTLLTHDGAGHRVAVNKSSSGDTASLIFQSDWVGNAEMGLAGNNDFSLKVSNNGQDWRTALVADAATGALTFPNGGDAATLFRKDAPSETFFVDAVNGDDANSGKSAQTAVKSLAGLAPLLPAYTSINIRLLSDLICDHQIRFLTMCPNVAILGRTSDDSTYQLRKITVADVPNNQSGGIAFFAHASAYLVSLEIDLVSTAPRSFIMFSNCVGYLRTLNCKVTRPATGRACLFSNGSSFVPSQHTNLDITPDASGYIARGLAPGANPNDDWRYPCNLTVM